jgi:hypothetical protein
MLGRDEVSVDCGIRDMRSGAANSHTTAAVELLYVASIILIDD